MEKFTFFWNGPFSQWHPCKFKVHEHEFNCAEQFMMASKASFFGDQESYEKIMASKNPKEQKQLGRKVKDFIAAEWDEVAKSVVRKGNYAKFMQNPDLLEKLLETKGTTLVEASPYDKIWGIGLSEADERCLDRNQWKGTNWLGEVLTFVRDRIIEEKEKGKSD